MKYIVLFLLILTPVSGLAIPGVDTATALKQYYVLVKQLHELREQVNQAKEMINQGKKVVNDAEGHYGYGNLLNSHRDQSEKNWAPDDWNDALHELSGGNSSRYHQLLEAYEKDHPTLSAHTYSKGASQSLVRSYTHSVAVNKIASLQSDQEYNHLNGLKSNINKLSHRIEEAPNTKAAMDLNSRLLAELSYISVEQLRMQTLMNHQMASEQSNEIDAESRESIFNQLPAEK